MPASTHQRFDRRAVDYADGRPDYPEALIAHLVQRLALPPGAGVADVGSGTGLFTRALLDWGLKVAAVEPSDAMRQAAERLLGARPGFLSLKGTAGATGLADAAVDAVFCAQAFHWFNEEATRREWRRILRPGGSAVLVWNYADAACPFAAAYVEVIREFAPDGPRIMASAWDAHRHNVLFGPEAETVWFPHPQSLDFDAVQRRAASTSYLPGRDDPPFAALTARLREIFARHQSGGRVRFDYRTVAVLGTIR